MNPASPSPSKIFSSFFLICTGWLLCFSANLAWAQPYQELKDWVGQNPFTGIGTQQGKSLYEDQQFQNVFLKLLKNHISSQQAEEIWDNILKQSDKAQVMQMGEYMAVVGFNCRWQNCPEHHILFYNNKTGAYGMCLSKIETISSGSVVMVRQMLQFLGSKWPALITIHLQKYGKGCFGQGNTPKPFITMWENITPSIKNGF